MKKSTRFALPDEVGKKWCVVDAAGKPLGRLSSRVAWLLMGKHKPKYSPHVECGDFVVVVNAEKVHLTGRKEEQKLYQWHTGYPGGLKQRRASEMRAKQPTKLVEWSVRGMLPKTRLGKRMFHRLKVYAGPDHPHAAQSPEAVEL